MSGTIRRYRNGSLDGFSTAISSIENIYLDGISLTYQEQESRKHIWSFADHAFCLAKCPLIDSPLFVNISFTCDTLQSDATLWNNNSCGPTTSSWFFQLLPKPTTSDTEMRLCCNSDRNYEDRYWK